MRPKFFFGSLLIYLVSEMEKEKTKGLNVVEIAIFFFLYILFRKFVVIVIIIRSSEFYLQKFQNVTRETIIFNILYMYRFIHTISYLLYRILYKRIFKSVFT